MPSFCMVQIGDKDPLKGEEITDINFFTEYYRLVDHQIYIQSKETKGVLYMDVARNNEGEDCTKRKTDLNLPANNPFS